MGCTGSTSIVPSLFAEVPVKVNLNIKSGDAGYHKRVNAKGKPEKCMYCSKKGTMMAPLVICGCCDKWACSACQKANQYFSTVQPVPATCKFSARSPDQDNSNQANAKFVCGQCHDNCVYTTVKAFADASLPLIKALNEDFKKKIVSLSDKLPLPIPDEIAAREKLLLNINGVKPLSDKEKIKQFSAMATKKVLFFPPNTELCLTFPNITCVECKPSKLRELSIAYQCQHGLGYPGSSKACENKAMIRATGINDCICCGNATCRSHWDSPPLSIPNELILLNDMYNHAGIMQKVCRDCINNLIAYWLFTMTVDSFDDAIPRLQQVIQGVRPNDYEVPKPAASMLGNLMKALPSSPAELKEERIAYQYSKPSKGLLSMVVGEAVGEKAEVGFMLFGVLNSKYKKHDKLVTKEIEALEVKKAFKLSLPNFDSAALTRLMYYSSRYYDMRWKLAFTEDKGDSVLKEIPVTFPKLDEDFVGEELDDLGKAADKLSKEDMAIIDEIGNCCGYAEMMYALEMPKPQDTPEWQSWYLAKLLGPEWSLIHCRSDTTYYPDDRIACAFALVTRKNKDGTKEAMLILRGTKSFSDWHINMNKGSLDYSYRAGASGDKEVKGKVHIGMYNSASAILDVHCIKFALLHLFDNGFKINIVGHSLGAGTGALILLEFKRILWNRAEKMSSLPKSKKGIFDGRVSAILFGVPPVVCENIADVLFADDNIKSVVYAHDMIPRFNEDNINKMIRNVHCLKEYAKQAWNENKTQALSSLVSPKKKMKGAADVAEGTVEAEGTAEAEAATLEASTAAVDAPASETSGKANESTKSAAASADLIKNAAKAAEKVAEMAAAARKAGKAAATDDGDDDDEDGDGFSFKVPGMVYYIYQHSNSVRYFLKKGNYKMATLNRLWPVLSGYSHHKMSAYRSAMRGLRLQNVGTLICDFKRLNKMNPSYDMKKKQWLMCEICTMDPMWVYTLNTPADKGHNYRNCSYCGRVVCVICSPAGEVVMDKKLENRSVVSPSLGIYEPALTCINCYLHSYEYEI